MLTRRVRLVVLLAGIGVLIPTVGVSQPEVPLSPRAFKPVPVAETRLLMEGLAQPNFKGLETMLKDKPENNDAWTFARGQALLIAETGNLLLMRPPTNQGQEAWAKTSKDLREAATRLARSAAERDLAASRTRLGEVAAACNQCHRSFGVKTTFTPFRDDSKPVPMPPESKPAPMPPESKPIPIVPK